MIARANTHVGNLKARCEYLQGGIADGCPAADHCRNMLQFSLAANRILGDFFSESMMSELNQGPAQSGQPVRQSPIQGGVTSNVQPGGQMNAYVDTT